MRAVYLASVCLHILAAMTWLGGMVVFVAAVMPWFRREPVQVRAAFLQWFGRRFRLISWICFAVLAATGTVNLSMRGVRLDDLLRPEWRGTGFGRLVIVKLGLVAVAAAVTVIHERPTSHAAARWLGRALLLIGVTIVGVAVMLVRAV
jgi:putative copper export protein